MSFLQSFATGLVLLMSSLVATIFDFSHPAVSPVTKIATSTAQLPTNQSQDSIATTTEWFPLSAINNSGYSEKRGSIYWAGQLLKGADQATFSITEGFAKDSSVPVLAKDKYHIYIGGDILQEADPTTFSVVPLRSGVLSLYAKDKNHVFELDIGTPILARFDPATFSVLDYPPLAYLKDKTHVSFENNQVLDRGVDISVDIKGADPSTFSVLANANYAKDRNHVYYDGQPIPHADPPTFQSLNGNSDKQIVYSFSYAKDKNHVYVNDQIIPDADLQTFSVFSDDYTNLYSARGSLYSRDKNHIFHNVCSDEWCTIVNAIIVPGADPLTFVPLAGNPDYDAQDKNNMYLNGEIVSQVHSCFDRSNGYVSVTNNGGLTAVNDADFATFVPFAVYSASPQGECYGKDKNHVFWSSWQDTGVITNADTATFTTDNSIYPFAKDKSHVFLLDKSIPAADPATFHVVDTYHHAIDKNNVYYFGIEVSGHVSVIRGADTNTFQSVASTFYGTDKNNVYCLDTILPGADVRTFHMVNTSGFQDKNHTYDAWCRTIDSNNP